MAPGDPPPEEFHPASKAKPRRRRTPSDADQRLRQDFPDHGTALPFCSTSAVTSPSAGAGGAAGSGAAAASSPRPATTCPAPRAKQEQPQSRSLIPQRPELPPSFSFFFPFEIPSGVELLARSQLRKRHKEKTPTLLLTAQQSPCRRAPCSRPAPPRRQPRRGEADRPGSRGPDGPQRGGGTGRSSLALPPSEGGGRLRRGGCTAAAEPPAGSKVRAGTAALTRLGEPPWWPSPPRPAPGSLRPRSAEAAGRGRSGAHGTQWPPGGEAGPALGAAPAARSRGALAEGQERRWDRADALTLVRRHFKYK